MPENVTAPPFAKIIAETWRDPAFKGKLIADRCKSVIIMSCGVFAATFVVPVSAQETRWDSILSSSNWYVPVPYLIAFTSGNRSLSINPVRTGDQTLWAIGTASHGVFSGTTQASFSFGSTVMGPVIAAMQGTVTEAGLIRIAFTPSDGTPTVIAVGNMRQIAGEPLMEMQMITGAAPLTTHWAYMATYNPATFTPASPTQVLPVDVISPEWRWSAGTTWRLTSQALFGTAAPGTFKITNYNSGYYWGVGAAPAGSTVGNFTVLGSITPEGRVLFTMLPGGDSWSSLTGQISGDATTGAMLLRPYLSEPFSAITRADIMPVSAIAAGQTYFLSNVGSTVIPAFTGGTLQVDTPAGTYAQNFTVDGSINNRLDQRGNAAWLTGVLSDAAPGIPGNLTIANSGVGGGITLAGASTYSGLTTVEAGAKLSVDGSIVSPVVVFGTLGGSGVVGTTQINGGGTLSPGNSIGTITVNGNLTFAAGSTYAVEVSPHAADRTNVTGTAALAGTLQSIFSPGTYYSRNYTLLSATGGRTGTFGTFSTEGLPGGFQSSLSYTPTDVVLNLTAALGGGTALSGNQANVANAVNARFNSGNSLSSGLYGLFSMSGRPLTSALNQLSGEVATSTSAMGFASGEQFLATMLDPLGYGRDSMMGGRLRPGGDGDVDGNTGNRKRYAVWGTATGAYNRTTGDAQDGSASRAARTAGFALGFDHRIGAQSMAGVAIAVGESNASLSSGQGSASANFGQIGAYGTTRVGSFTFSGAGAFTFMDVDTKRTLYFLNSDAQRAGFGAQGYSLRAEARQDGVALGDGWRMKPIAALQWQQVNNQGYTESSLMTGTTNGVTVGRQSQASLRSEVGAQLDGSVQLGAVPVQGYVRAAWAHYMTRDASMTVGFASLPSGQFSARGARPDANAALLSGGLEVPIAAGLTLGARVDSEFSGNVIQVAVTARLRYRF
jgi:uncharacterized protein with beta-barrel porin domain